MSAMPWVLMALAVAAAIYRVILVMTKTVDHDVLSTVLQRLFLAGDLARSKKLLSAIPGVPVGIAMRAVVVRAEELPAPGNALVARDGLEKTFEATFADAAAPIGASRFLSVVAVLFAAGSLGISLQVGIPPLPLLIAGGLVVVAVGQAARVAHIIATRGPSLFQKCLPALLERVGAGNASTYREQGDDASKTVPLPAAGSGPLQPRPGVIFVDVVRAGVPTRQLELDQPVLKIGTHTTAHVPIEAEKGVGRMHAVIERTDEGAQIIDLGNQAGTIVGGARVTRTKLQQGDEVIVGTTMLRIGLGLPPAYLELEPVDTDDPKTWDPAAMFLYGFDTRSPDLFYEIVDEIVRASPAAKGLRLAKLRRPAGGPSFVVAL
ncbi:MAG: FHA domain-containing protein, partial [Polyangiales bacterium]